MDRRMLPVGIDNFKSLIQNNYYYVDKTQMIKEVLDKKGGVSLFTRPRRFGKTLNMSMLQYFFEDTGSTQGNEENRSLFQGLKIMEAGEAYTNCMGKYPVIGLSLKSAKQPDFETAYYCVQEELAREFKRHREVMDSITEEEDRRRYRDIMNRRGERGDFATSLRFLSDCLRQFSGTNTIILLDEYDVPLENAYYNGFYEKMAGFIRSLFESALKTNPYLEFAVITGCLRISRESIFTGLNNLNILSILSNQYDEYFGFLQSETDALLAYYGLEKKKEILRKWYDGYRFGKEEVYNPWSVINYVNALTEDAEELPRPYWSNTSSNSIVKDLVKRADASVRAEIEQLIEGGSIEKAVHEDITYDSVYDSPDNLWNFLFFTGYLRQVSRRLNDTDWFVTLAIPNKEIRYIYKNTIKNWFQENLKTKDLSQMYEAMFHGDVDGFQQEMSALLINSISYMDNHEVFYHGFLLGVLGNLKDYLVKSNHESGNGRLDISVRSLDVKKTPVIIEIKVANTFKELESACCAALEQIEQKRYDSWLPAEGYTDVWNYGIAFFRKQCRIKGRYKTL